MATRQDKLPDRYEANALVTAIDEQLRPAHSTSFDK